MVLFVVSYYYTPQKKKEKKKKLNVSDLTHFWQTLIKICEFLFFDHATLAGETYVFAPVSWLVMLITGGVGVISGILWYIILSSLSLFIHTYVKVLHFREGRIIIAPERLIGVLR